MKHYQLPRVILLELNDLKALTEASLKQYHTHLYAIAAICNLYLTKSR